MIVTAVYFAARLVIVWRWKRQIHREVNIAELAMGVAMAGMLKPSFNLLPDALWEVIFAAFALWFLFRYGQYVGRHGWKGGDPTVAHHRVHFPLHVVMSFGMLYMYFAGSSPVVRAGSGMAMTAPTGAVADFTWIPLLLVVSLCAFAVSQVDGLSRLYETRKAAMAGGDVGVLVENPLDRWLIDRSLAPRSETVGLVSMSITMAFMLVLML